MQLVPGSHLGTYEIIGLLGAGGMGEVYRAQDTKLNRQVAIKVLPEAYASDPDRVVRFHREAQAVAALNHTNIAAIYDLAEAGPTKFLVLELIEGDTLAARLRRGPVPIDEALGITRQILEALEAAHEKGICHRDLKPANVKLTAEGVVKVLDFGLAKFLQSSPAAGNLTHSPTLSVAGTYPGVILGTAGYMSPEQAKGYEADHRSDLFSVGCILYELLTGRQAFEGETASEILAGVLKSDVDMTALPPRLNPRIVDLLRRCLEKNPKKRWHAAADVRVEVESLTGRSSIIEEAPRMIPRSRWQRAWPIAATAIVTAMAGAAAAWLLKPVPARTITRFTITLPEERQFTNTGRQLIALSPDGENLVYVANRRLFLRSLSGLESRPIAGSEGGAEAGVLNPVVSPDGTMVAYWTQTDQTLKRLSINGGAAVTVCRSTAPYGLSWSVYGIVFGQAEKGIMRVSPNGGTPEVIAEAGPGMLAGLPQMLPGGRAVLFSTKKQADSWDTGHLVVQTLGGDRKVIVEGASDGRYVSSGHLVYAVSGVLLAVPFDLNALAVTGRAVPVVEGVSRAVLWSAAGNAQYAFSDNGTLAYIHGPAALSSTGDLDIGLFDLKGGVQPFKLPPGPYRAPRASPDGRFVAFDIEDDREPAVWIYEIAGGSAMRRLTFGGRNQSPVWSPDGEWVAFESDRDGDAAIFRQRADGTGAPERLTTAAKGESHRPHSWSADGSVLLYSLHKEREATLWLWSMKDRKAAPLPEARSATNIEGSFSPDGRWIAYQTHDSTTVPGQVYLQPFPPTGTKYLVGAGGHPYWTPKGTELIVNTGPGRSAVIRVTTSPRVSFGQPQALFRDQRAEPNSANGRRNADHMPDQQRILGVTRGATSPGAQAESGITVVLNWFDDVRARAPRN
ncbi:MAG: protein kinase [Vicinamibacterales bacterium]